MHVKTSFDAYLTNINLEFVLLCPVCELRKTLTIRKTRKTPALSVGLNEFPQSVNFWPEYSVETVKFSFNTETMFHYFSHRDYYLVSVNFFP